MHTAIVIIGSKWFVYFFFGKFEKLTDDHSGTLSVVRPRPNGRMVTNCYRTLLRANGDRLFDGNSQSMVRLGRIDPVPAGVCRDRTMREI